MNVLEGVDGHQITQMWLDCYRHLNPQAPDDFRQLAALLVDYWIERDIRQIGIGGGQGAGKSTLSRLIASAFAHMGETVAMLSIDDFIYPLESGYGWLVKCIRCWQLEGHRVLTRSMLYSRA